MLIHKDGKTNLTQLDSRTEKACEWIKSKPITKVLMNPPFENKYGCIPIVKNQLSKSDEYAYYMAFRSVEKLGGQIVALGDPADSRYHKKTSEGPNSSKIANVINTDKNTSSIFSFFFIIKP